MRTIFVALIFGSFSSFCQSLTASQQKALNNYIQYANQSAQEVTFVYNRVLAYYSRLDQFKKKRQRPSFVCDNQLEDLLYNKALSEGNALGGAAGLNSRVKTLRAAALLIDEKCKALDTYHKLEDYQKDNFQQAEQLITEIQLAFKEYRSAQSALGKDLEGTYRKLQPANAANAYSAVDQMMRKEVARERSFLDSLAFNINDNIFTGWPVDQLQQSILQTEKAVAVFGKGNFTLKYPAANMPGAFREELSSLLSSKRSGLDGFNFDARQSDQYSNGVYGLLMSYFGSLVYDHNQFLEFAKADGFYGLQSLQLMPYFEIRKTAKLSTETIQEFKDTPYQPLKTAKQATPIPKPVFQALVNYTEFINETVDQINYLQRVLRSVSSDAPRYANLTSYKGKGGLTFDDKDFQIPLSLHQKSVTQSIQLPAAFRRPLNEQADVILGILKELDALGVAMTVETRQKKYEKDNLKRVFEILERNEKLFDIIDQKKEQLYTDVRVIYESYPQQNPAGSWAVSNKALLQLVDEDKIQLFKAKAYCKGDSTSLPETTLMDRYLREIIAKEFANMKGIERLGRYNGLCPYTPYEDIPAHSKTFSEKLNDIKNVDFDSYGGPYRDFEYMFNLIAEDYNKFCELAKIDLLPQVIQPELFLVQYPDRKDEHRKTQADTPAESPAKQETIDPTPVEKQQPIGKPIGNVTHSETNNLDTVYIEKHDTIYIDHMDDNPGSLEGYAANNLVFLLDISGSMSEGGKLQLLKNSMLALVTMLRPEDLVSVVVYSGKAQVILPPASGTEKQKIKKVIEELNGDGYTDGNAGIQLAYKVADGNYIRGGNNRIILATDGEFNVNNPTMKTVAKYADNDIFLSVFIFGAADATVKTLATLATTAKGHLENITIQNANSKLIREAKAKRKK